MARTAGIANFRTLEFMKKFDDLARKHIDPMELLFQIAAKGKGIGTGWDNRDRLSAAQCLMSYRYPRLKALEITESDNAPKVQISWIDDAGDELQPCIENTSSDVH